MKTISPCYYFTIIAFIFTSFNSTAQDAESLGKGANTNGHFGFEFLIKRTKGPCVTYYKELGGIGKPVRAEKLLDRPVYSNGFTAQTGVRFHLF